MICQQLISIVNAQQAQLAGFGEATIRYCDENDVEVDATFLVRDVTPI